MPKKPKDMMHKMPGGMMMKDSEMKSMMNGSKAGAKGKPKVKGKTKKK